jgi:hypothetical protein
MNKAKHNTGPWDVEEPFAGRLTGPSIWWNGILLAQVAGLGTFDHGNARLIAASPRMYDFIAKHAGHGDIEARSIIEGINATRN